MVVAKAFVKIFNKKFHRYLSYAFVWFDKENQWLTIRPILSSPNMQDCYTLHEYLFAQVFTLKIICMPGTNYFEVIYFCLPNSAHGKIALTEDLCDVFYQSKEFSCKSSIDEDLVLSVNSYSLVIKSLT